MLIKCNHSNMLGIQCLAISVTVARIHVACTNGERKRLDQWPYSILYATGTPATQCTDYRLQCTHYYRLSQYNIPTFLPLRTTSPSCNGIERYRGIESLSMHKEMELSNLQDMFTWHPISTSELCVFWLNTHCAECSRAYETSLSIGINYLLPYLLLQPLSLTA